MKDKLSRRAFLQASVGFSLVTYLAACAPAAGPGAQSGDASEAETQIMFWPRGANDEQVLASMVPILRDQHPNIDVAFDTPPEQIYEKLSVAIAGGTAPDSTVINTPWGVPMMGQGAFLNLQDFIETNADIQEAFNEHYARPAVSAYQLEGSSYTVPMTSESIVMWYNLDAIEEAGLTPPKDIEDDPEQWNWGALVAYADALNIGTGRDRDRFGIICSGPRHDYGLQIGFGNFVFSNGGRFISDDGRECIFDSVESTEAVRFVHDFIFEHDTHPEITSLLEYQNGRVAFLSGQTGLLLEGEFLRRYLWGALAPSDGVPFRYDLAKMPFIDGERAMVYHCLGAPILQGSAHPDETWEWLSVIGSQEGQQIITDNWGSRGADVRTYESWLANDGQGGPEGINVQAITDSDEFGVPIPVSPYMQSAQLLEPITRIMYDLVLQNSMGIEEGLVEIEREVNDRLEQSIREMGL